MKQPLPDGVWLAPDQLFSLGRLRSGLAIQFVAGQACDIADCRQLPKDADIRRTKGVVSAGLVDLQVNGGGGILFNCDPTPTGIAAIIEAHRNLGTARLLPTAITDAEVVLECAADAVITAWGQRGLAGIHIEGPHISHAKRGTHAPEFIRPMGNHTLRLVERLRAHRVPTIITLAPEAATPEQIHQITRTGAIVSLGHSNAGFAETNAALAAGASCFTHLFNGMSQMTGREPGMVGSALVSDAYVGLICDGHHVSDEMLKLALRAKAERGRLFVVSDAMPTVGGPDHFSLYGAEIVVRDGKLVNREGSLAGAHVSMAESVARLVRVLAIAPELALQMAITIPAKLIGIESQADILGAAVDELLLWNSDLSGWRQLATPEL